jgi:pimeloyl-ACP methyl ester carboxylesterase
MASAFAGALLLLVAGSAPAGVVRVDGRAMYYVCEGSGRPTVVLEAGSPDDSGAWALVQPRVARFTRVCAYDRAGLGRSAAPAHGSKRTAGAQVAELRALLTAAHIDGPYVVVGHSWGGALAQIFASRYSGETAGVVLLDPFFSSPNLVRLLRQGRAPGPLTKVEHLDLLASLGQLGTVRTLGDRPLVVVRAGKPPPTAELLSTGRALSRLSDDGILAIARTSTHDLPAAPPAGDPAVAVAAIRGVVEAARSRLRLPACASVFSGLAVQCLSRWP